MPSFQILECSEVLGTCCSDYALVTLFDIVRKVFDLLQILVPIILILMTIIQMVKLTANPELKNGTKKVITNLIATVIIFFLPTIVDTVMGILPTSESFQVAACWSIAQESAEVVNALETKYVDPNDKDRKSPILIDPSEYDAATGTSLDDGGGSSGSSSSSGTVSNGTSSATGKAIVEYASKFLGNRYCWGGKDPNTCADCSGFVSYVFKHFGINLISQTSAMWGQTDMYTLVSSGDIRAGDVIMYDGHVGILTGNGAEIIHAKGTKYGIVKDSDYRKCSSKAIKGIMRIKGVN